MNKKINQEVVLKVIDAMLSHNSINYFENMNCYVLDMDKGFLFYNDKSCCLYHGFSKLEMPSYLSSEAQRSSSTIPYTTGCNNNQFVIAERRNEDDFNKLYNQIIEA